VLDRLLAPLGPRSPYPGSADGALPEAYSSCLDPLETLAFAAAHTTSLGLGTSVLNLPWYRPLDLARRLASLDVLSKGRLRVGFGLGWSEDEYRGLGVTFHRRGRSAEDALRALLALWRADPVEFRGDGIDVPPSRTGPKPVQRPHPPFYFAAFSEPALRRIAHYGDGWMPAGLPPAVVSDLWRQLLELTEAEGRDPMAQRLIIRANTVITAEPAAPHVGPVRHVTDELLGFAEIGAHEIHLDLQFDAGIRTATHYLDTAEEILARLRDGLGEVESDAA
jgi:probable F420-dependent oxidoreductase